MFTHIDSYARFSRFDQTDTEVLSSRVVPNAVIWEFQEIILMHDSVYSLYYFE